MQQDRLEIIKKAVSGFSRILGEQTEIALHDLEKKELYYIVNGHVTGRTTGYKMNPSVYDTVLGLVDEDDCVIGYASHGPSGNSLRSSHIFFRDETGTPYALVCVNQDTSRWKELRDAIDTMIQCRSLNEKATFASPAEENYIQNLTRQVIIDTVENSKPSTLETKQEKMEVLRQLDIKGVFTVKDAVPIVCKMLSISQATLYNYLREVRQSSDL